MKTLRVILSPHFYEEEYDEAVSGITFKKGNGANVYSIELSEARLTGIQTALRKNILLPYDAETLEYVNGKNIVQEEVVEVAEEVVIETAVEEPKKKPRKKPVKKDEQEVEEKE